MIEAAPDYIRFMTAAEWGMTWKRAAVPEKLNDPEVFVHHSAGSRLNDDAAVAFRLLNEFAQNSKNYSALDYDILVHKSSSGVITVGGGREEWMSAATRDRNEQGEAVCLLGYFHPGHQLSEVPDPREIEGVAWAIIWGIEKGWIAKDAVILGHRENPAHPGATACPGDFLFAEMDVIRTRVAQILSQFDKPEVEIPVDNAYIVKSNQAKLPWFYVWNGDVRYCTGRDVDYAKANGIPILNDTDERYGWLYRQVFGQQLIT